MSNIQTSLKLGSIITLDTHEKIELSQDTLNQIQLKEINYFDERPCLCVQLCCPIIITAYIYKVSNDLWVFGKYVQNHPLSYFNYFWFDEHGYLNLKLINKKQVIKNDSDHLLIDDVIELVQEYS